MMKQHFFYSIMPMLENEIGHIFQYNLSISKIVEKNGQTFVGYVPKSSSIQTLPINWKNILPADSWQKHRSFKDKVGVLCRSILIYSQIFKEASKHQSIIFLEHFSLVHLVAILISLLISKRKFNLWLLHRYLPFKKKKKLMRWIHNLFAGLLGNQRLKLFTDSDLLAKELNMIFNRKIITLPIPHAILSSKEAYPKEQALYLWCPGSIRPEKGIIEVKNIIPELSTDFKLIMSLDAQNKCGFHSNHIIWVPTELSRKEYEKWMNTADIILLPYDPNVYSHGTSGIFVEAILSKKIPVVKDGSWLAYELKKFELDDLIIDWAKPPILPQLISLVGNPNIREKLIDMHKHYLEYHCAEKISEILKKLSLL